MTAQGTRTRMRARGCPPKSRVIHQRKGGSCLLLGFSSSLPGYGSMGGGHCFLMVFLPPPVQNGWGLLPALVAGRSSPARSAPFLSAALSQQFLVVRPCLLPRSRRVPSRTGIMDRITRLASWGGAPSIAAGWTSSGCCIPRSSCRPRAALRRR